MGKHSDEEDKKPVGEERTKITPEQRKKALEPDPKPKPDKPGRGRHRR